MTGLVSRFCRGSLVTEDQKCGNTTGECNIDSLHYHTEDSNLIFSKDEDRLRTEENLVSETPFV